MPIDKNNIGFVIRLIGVLLIAIPFFGTVAEAADCPPTYLACKYIDQSGYIEMYSLNVGKTVDKIDIAGEVKTQWGSDGFGFRIEADGVEIKSFRNTGPFTLVQTVSVNKYVNVLKVYGYTEGYAPKDANGNPTSGWVTSTHVLTKLAVTTATPTPTPTPCPPAGTYLACKYIDQSGYIEMYSLNVGKTVDKIDIAGEVKTQWGSDGFGFRIEADGVEIKSFRNTGPFTLAQTVSVNKYVNVLKVYGYTEGYAPKDANGNPTSGWVTSTHVLTKLAVTTATTPPTISISSPYNGQSFTTNTITVSGTASDNVGLSKVEVKVGAGSWQLASGTTSWSKQVTLTSGSNTIYARATDTSGKTAEDSVTVTYNPPTQTTSATISLSGISPSYNAGDTFSATVYVTNTGETSHTFPVGFSVRDPNGNWNDIPYKTVTLSSSLSSTVYFTYNIPSAGPAGTWTVRTAVYDYDAGGGNLQTRYDYKEQIFSITSTECTDNYREFDQCAAVKIGEAWVDFDESSDGWIARLKLTNGNVQDVGDKSQWYAGEIIKKANEMGYKVIKWQSNMAFEIVEHVIGYRSIVGRSQAEIIDIELWTQSRKTTQSQTSTPTPTKPIQTTSTYTPIPTIIQTPIQDDGTYNGGIYFVGFDSNGKPEGIYWMDGGIFAYVAYTETTDLPRNIYEFLSTFSNRLPPVLLLPTSIHYGSLYKSKWFIPMPYFSPLESLFYWIPEYAVPIPHWEVYNLTNKQGLSIYGPSPPQDL